MSNTDYEDDAKRKLSITDPSGNTATLEPGTKLCPVCRASCVYAKHGNCQGEVDMMSDMHLCEEHKKQRYGGDNRWYNSVETDKPGPVERMVGEKELSNWGGTYDEEEQPGETNNDDIREG